MTNNEELHLNRAVARGSFAQDVLQNSEFKRITSEIREHLLEEFKSTKFSQKEERDEIWRKFQSLQWIERAMERSASDGSIAKRTLIERMKEKFTNNGD